MKAVYLYVGVSRRALVVGLLVVVLSWSLVCHAQAPATGPQFPGMPPGAAPPSPVAAPTGQPPAAPPTVGDPQPPSGTQALVEERVVDVRIVGNHAFSTTKILAQLTTRKDRPFEQNSFEKDVRKLMAKGWFLDVKPKREPVPGGVIVTFEVVERPTLEFVKYLGCKKIASKTLAKETELKKGDALDPYAVEEGKRKIEAYYESKGYNNVKVAIMEGNKTSDKGAIYLINEGHAQKIWKVQFVGNTIASGPRLYTQIQSKKPILYFFKGYVDRKKIDEDLERLTSYYRSLGFFRARVGRELDFNEDESWLTITFVIDEGPRYKVRNVTFVGNTKYSTEQLAQDLTVISGKFFDQAGMTKDIALLRDLYGSQGYVFADVQADPRFLEEPGQLDLVYNISEGDRYRAGKVNVHIAGDNPHTRLKTVLVRTLPRPGDIVDIRKVRASERRLKAAGIFMNDPTKGVAPKIVFTPPGADSSEKAIARRNADRDSFRGQSPDGPVVWPAAPAGIRDSGEPAMAALCSYAEGTQSRWVDALWMFGDE